MLLSKKISCEQYYNKYEMMITIRRWVEYACGLCSNFIFLPRALAPHPAQHLIFNPRTVQWRWRRDRRQQRRHVLLEFRRILPPLCSHGSLQPPLQEQVRKRFTRRCIRRPRRNSEKVSALAYSPYTDTK